MTMDIAGFGQLVQSLNHYHRITNEKLSGDSDFDKDLVKNLYVDLLPNDGILKFILQKRTTFLIGCKGTGKSTIFARAQYEIRNRKKDLSVYINAKSIYKLSEANNLDFRSEALLSIFTSDELFKIALIENTMKDMKRSLYEELKLESNGFFDSVKNVFRNNRLEKIFTEIDNLIENPTIKNISKLVKEQRQTQEYSEIIADIKASLSDNGLSLSNGITGKTTAQDNKAYDSIIAKYFNIGNIVNKFIEVIEICNRENIYLFIDDYSELSSTSRKLFMQTIVEPFYHIGADKVFLKISAYPGKYSPINLDTQKYDIRSIDLFDIYGRNNTLTETERKAAAYTERLIQNRLTQYCTSKFKDYFDITAFGENDYYVALYQCSKNVPRTLGGILTLSYQLAILEGKKITPTVLYETIKMYYEDTIKVYFNKRKASLSNQVDEKIDVFVQESLLDDIIKTSQKYKYELPGSKNSYFSDLAEAYTSHFTVSPNVSEFLDELEFNGFLHRLNSVAAKGRDSTEYVNKTNYLYSLDFGLCLSEKILYGKPEKKDTKYYQQRVFVYDDVIINSLSSNKKIVCQSCGAIFEISELESFQKFRMKCMKCDPGFCEVIYDRSLHSLATSKLQGSICTDEEIDIMTILRNHLKQANDTMVSARELSLETDYTSNTIAWKCKKLNEAGLIHRYTEYTPYKYGMTDRGKSYIENILTEN